MTATLPPDDHDSFDLPEALPLLPIRDLVVFPYMIVPLFVSRDVSIAAIDEALAKDRLVFLAAQRDGTLESPGPDDVHRTGTVGMIMRMRKLPDGRIKILVQGLLRARALEFLRDKPSMQVRIDRVAEAPAAEVTVETEALMRSVKESLEKLIQTGKQLPADIMLVIGGIADPGRLADLVASNLGLKVPEAQAILENPGAIERLRSVNDHLEKEVAVVQMQQRIQSQAKEELTKTQREYWLREQLRQIQAELGEGDGKLAELAELKNKIEAAKMPAEAHEEATRQLRRLEGMHSDSAEASVIRTYLDWLVDLPWSKTSADVLDLKAAKAILDDDHYGLDKVKERLLEFLGVRKLKSDMKGPILCLQGPPGVGKTSLGRSIARAMGRSFVRVSLGGVRDEAEIRGHRRTYVGAMPGKIVQGLKTAGTANPVFILDEIDKLGADFRGDPSSALLEVLDPEQNAHFRDHYLNVDFDLSKVLFIATANVLDTIPAALRDRMEVISIAGYTELDKLHICRRHLVPKQLAEHGLTPEHCELTDRALKALIRGYTREAGLRNLERTVAAVCRKVARKVAEGRTRKTTVTAAGLPRWLGPQRFHEEGALAADEVGTVTGLAWTQGGGEVLRVEAVATRGKGGLILTGQLGEVMKESTRAALSWVRAHAPELGVPDGWFEDRELHIHVPAGAIPKDGPSAGVSMATALVSVATGVPVKRTVAMTGEVTLRGRVLAIGGLKEKLLAAHRHGITDVVLPEENERDLAEVPAVVRKRLRLHPVATLDEVLDVALAGGRPKPPNRAILPTHLAPRSKRPAAKAKPAKTVKTVGPKGAAKRARPHR